MRSICAVASLVLLGCGAPAPDSSRTAARVEPEEPAPGPVDSGDDEPASCPPQPCAGPEPNPEALLARAVRIAREHAWQDTGGQGAEPEASPDAAWAHGPRAAVDAVVDQVGAITVRELPTARRPGASAFLAMHTDAGWFACELGARRGRRGPADVEFVELPSEDPSSSAAENTVRTEPFFEGAPAGVVARFAFRETWNEDDVAHTDFEEHVAYCGVENRPVCYGVVPVGVGHTAAGARRVERSQSWVESELDGEGSVTVRPEGAPPDPDEAPALAAALGTHRVRGLGCATAP